MDGLACKDSPLAECLRCGTSVLAPAVIAAERMRRFCHGLELDEHFTAQAIAHWDVFSGKTALRQSG